MLLSYLKRHVKIIVMTGLSVIGFAAVFSLYDLPAEAVWYAALLCAVLGLILFAVGFGQYLRRHRELAALQNSVTISLDGLPRPKDALEADYQALLQLLRHGLAQAEARAGTERRDATDYYTLWAHQIKTPIAALRLLLQSGERAENAVLEAELFRIEQYVEMVLSYQRLDSGASDYLLREYDLDGIVRQAVRKYARLFILKKLPLTFRESGLKAMTDEKWLAFVIEQLLSNALKYTPQGGRISIYADGMTLVIADTGIGIKPEDLPRVFEKGFTGFNGRSDQKSTGIGLYLSSRVCAKLGHGLTLESEQGKGTKARVDLTRCAPVME